MNLVWKLLRAHLSPAQLIGFFFANLAGMVIVLLTLQIYLDLRPLFEGGDSFLKKDYLVVTKKVSTWGVLSGKDNTFSRQETEELARQPFVRKVAGFTASRFRVTAGVEIQGRGFATEMFFESVPDDYIDVNTDEWHFDEKEGVIPIIIPRNYLNLYNFGFAQSRSLPKLSENVIEMLRMDVELRGNGQQADYTGKVVGFSNRLNTILVPQQFMDWANRTFASGDSNPVSRLIVETGNPADERITRFFRQKGYESEEGKADVGKMTWFLNVLTISVSVVGLLICLLAFYILMLSIYLLLQKNSYKLENLLLIGYPVGQIARPYRNLTLFLNGSVIAAALLLVMLVRNFYMDWFRAIWPEFTLGGVAVLWMTGIGLFLLVSGFHVLVIRKKIKKL